MAKKKTADTEMTLAELFDAKLRRHLLVIESRLILYGFIVGCGAYASLIDEARPIADQSGSCNREYVSTFGKR